MLGTDALSISLLLLIMHFVVAWNYFRLLFILAERYVLLGVLSYTAPLAFATGGLSLIHIYTMAGRPPGALESSVWHLICITMGPPASTIMMIQRNSWRNARDIQLKIYFAAGMRLTFGRLSKSDILNIVALPETVL